MLLPPQAILGPLSKHVTLIMMIFSGAPTAEFILNLGADSQDQNFIRVIDQGYSWALPRSSTPMVPYTVWLLAHCRTL